MTFACTHIFTDGGVLAINPSPIGGTIAWIQIGPEHRVEFSLAVSADDCGMETVSNNLTELLAVVHALERLPEGWSGTVCSDSAVTIGRLSQGWAMNGIPAWLVQRMRDALQHVDAEKISWVLLDGHPSKRQLAAGIGKRGNPVSQWNVWCDKACTAAAREFMERLKPAGIIP